MSDQIYRQAAIDTLADMYCKSDEDGYVWIIRSDAWARLDALPSAQPERTGKWIEYDNSHCECPFCHEEWSYFDNEVECFNYCPNCGARMEP